MSEPLACAVMLTKDRPEMARRAVRCFREQTYDPARRLLLMLDMSEKPVALVAPDSENESQDWRPSWRERSIGKLRNMLGAWAPANSVLIHWDDDDWSHANRIAEQVAFLQQSGADAVGYREMLFWSTPKGHDINCEALDGYADDCTCGATGEAWLYSNPHPRYCLGTSLCYWRSAWERNPFPDTSKGEEGQPLVGWQSKLNCASISAMRAPESIHSAECDTPMMIASIHGGNTCSAIDPNSPFWKRAPEWDGYCRERMAL